MYGAAGGITLFEQHRVLYFVVIGRRANHCIGVKCQMFTYNHQHVPCGNEIEVCKKKQ